MRKSNEQSLGEVIKQVIKDLKPDEKITRVKIISSWEKVMGPQIHSLTSKVEYRNKILTVYLKSAPLREELSMAKTKIATMINKDVGSRAVDEIVFR